MINCQYCELYDDDDDDDDDDDYDDDYYCNYIKRILGIFPNDFG